MWYTGEHMKDSSFFPAPDAGRAHTVPGSSSVSERFSSGVRKAPDAKWDRHNPFRPAEGRSAVSELDDPRESGSGASSMSMFARGEHRTRVSQELGDVELSHELEKLRVRETGAKNRVERLRADYEDVVSKRASAERELRAIRRQRDGVVARHDGFDMDDMQEPGYRSRESYPDIGQVTRTDHRRAPVFDPEGVRRFKNPFGDDDEPTGIFDRSKLTPSPAPRRLGSKAVEAGEPIEEISPDDVKWVVPPPLPKKPPQSPHSQWPYNGNLFKKDKK